jgi:hypothetical protein
VVNYLIRARNALKRQKKKAITPRRTRISPYG